MEEYVQLHRVHVVSKMQTEENSEMAQVLQINHEKMKGMGEESYRLKETIQTFSRWVRLNYQA